MQREPRTLSQLARPRSALPGARWADGTSHRALLRSYCVSPDLLRLLLQPHKTLNEVSGQGKAGREGPDKAIPWGEASPRTHSPETWPWSHSNSSRTVGAMPPSSWGQSQASRGPARPGHPRPQADTGLSVWVCQGRTWGYKRKVAHLGK